MLHEKSAWICKIKDKTQMKYFPYKESNNFYLKLTVEHKASGDRLSGFEPSCITYYRCFCGPVIFILSESLSSYYMRRWYDLYQNKWRLSKLIHINTWHSAWDILGNQEILLKTWAELPSLVPGSHILYLLPS